MTAVGRYTGCDLSDLTALTLPWQMENGQPRPYFSRAAALLSLELSEAAYHLEEERWAQAGWQDILYRGEDVETNEEQPAGFGERVQGLLHRLKQNVTGIRHNKEEKKLDKTLLMAHPLPDGRVVIAVGLMGTEKRLSDWAVNMNVANEAGLHRGFASVARGLEETLGSISFRDTARQLGRPSLTLADVIGECSRPGSRFLLWLSGHSLGAAVMQIFALQLARRGVLPRYILGYGFASPRVLYEGFPGDISNFPVFNILSRDDLVPKVGALLHIGRCQLYTPDEAARQACFAGDWESEDFRRLFSLTARVHGTREFMVFLTALLRVVRQIPEEDILYAVSKAVGHRLPDMLSGVVSSRIDRYLDNARNKVEQVYLSVSGGEPLPKNQADLFYRLLCREIGAMGPRLFMQRILRIFTAPHHLVPKAAGMPAYATIVSRCFYSLRPCLSGDDVPVWRGKRARRAPSRGQSGRFGAYSAARRRVSAGHRRETRRNV